MWSNSKGVRDLGVLRFSISFSHKTALWSSFKRLLPRRISLWKLWYLFFGHLQVRLFWYQWKWHREVHINQNSQGSTIICTDRSYAYCDGGKERNCISIQTAVSINLNIRVPVFLLILNSNPLWIDFFNILPITFNYSFALSVPCFRTEC